MIFTCTYSLKTKQNSKKLLIKKLGREALRNLCRCLDWNISQAHEDKRMRAKRSRQSFYDMIEEFFKHYLLLFWNGLPTSTNFERIPPTTIEVTEHYLPSLYMQ